MYSPIKALLVAFNRVKKKKKDNNNFGGVN